MRLTRRRLLAGAAAGALGAGGIYELVDRLASSPERPVAVRRSREQHLLEGMQTITDEDVEVLVPPLHHRVVTARVRPGSDLRAAQAELERAGVDAVIVGATTVSELVGGAPPTV